jgi:nitrate reductase gamma subunit
MKYKLLLVLLSFFMATFAFSQSNTVEMADTMRREGKIYVVIAVILTIFAGIILYLVRLDRKISRLEKKSL